MIELWVVRHGETDWNLETRVQGSTDIPLNQTGIDQAARLAHVLEGIPFHFLFTSDLTRASQTAHILHQRVPAPLFVWPLLRERNFGSGEGLLRDDVFRRYPHGVPDGESESDLRGRARRVLHNMENIGRGRILCVSHGGMIRSLLTVAGLPTVPALTNTSISTLRWDGRRWRTHQVGSNRHVDVVNQ